MKETSRSHKRRSLLLRNVNSRWTSNVARARVMDASAHREVFVRYTRESSCAVRRIACGLTVAGLLFRATVAFAASESFSKLEKTFTDPAPPKFAERRETSSPSARDNP